MVRLLDAGHRERQFALDLWKKGGIRDGLYPYWRFIEEAFYDPRTDEIVLGDARWRVEISA